MKIGIGVGDIAGRGSSPTDQIEQIRALAAQGVRSAWLAQIFGADALTTIAVAGAQSPGIEFGTAVVPTYPRHPTALAAQAMTVQELLDLSVVTCPPGEMFSKSFLSPTKKSLNPVYHFGVMSTSSVVPAVNVGKFHASGPSVV